MNFWRSQKAKFEMRLIVVLIMISDNQHLIFTIFETNFDTLITKNQPNWRPDFVIWLIYLFKTVQLTENFVKGSGLLCIIGFMLRQNGRIQFLGKDNLALNSGCRLSIRLIFDSRLHSLSDYTCTCIRQFTNTYVRLFQSVLDHLRSEEFKFIF